MTKVITLPTFHKGQVDLWRNRAKRNAVCTGRRFGKTTCLVTLACDALAKGRKVGLFTPEHKQLAEPMNDIIVRVNPIITAKNKNEGVVRTMTGGRADFWHLTDNELAARGREYDLILLDEIAFTKNGQMLDIWHKGIIPTMATRPNADIWAFSTPNGVDTDNFFYKICHEPEMGFKVHHAPSTANPMVDREWVENEQKRLHPDIFSQEILAKFIRWDGVAFFMEDKCLENGLPVPYPTNCDSVFAVIDSAVKDGSENDGTAIIYCARNKWAGTPLIILDYDCIQIKADLLTDWVPNVVLPRLNELSIQCGAREGVRGIFVEDKSSGSVLLQTAARKGWPLVPIASDFTALGKDSRAIAVSGHWHQGLCKVSYHAYNKSIAYKGSTRNHMIFQLVSFRLGDKNAAKRADDLLDVVVYALGLTFGVNQSY